MGSEFFYYSSNESSFNSSNGKFLIIILGATGGRFDCTLSTVYSVMRCFNTYDASLCPTEIMMVSKSSATVILKPGVNFVKRSLEFELKEEGFSVVPLIGQGNVKVYEINEKEKKEDLLAGKLVFFDCVLDRFLSVGRPFVSIKKNCCEKLKIVLDCEESSVFLYITTLVFHSMNY